MCKEKVVHKADLCKLWSALRRLERSSAGLLCKEKDPKATRAIVSSGTELKDVNFRILGERAVYSVFGL